MRKKLGFALGAGGSRGVAHIGFLQAMEEAEIRPDFVTGCSMGAVVGACYCAGVTPEEMKAAALKLKFRDVAAFNAAPFHRNGLLKTTKARKLLVGMIGERTFDELELPFACVSTDLVTGRTVAFHEGNVADCVIASSSIPGAFTPATVGEYQMLVDGGILERVPTKELKKMGAEIIVAVDVLGDLAIDKQPSGHLLDTVLRCIDIMDTHRTQAKRGSRKYVDLWLEPALGNMNQYRIKNLAFAYEKGYELGKEHAEKIAELIGE